MDVFPKSVKSMATKIVVLDKIVANSKIVATIKWLQATVQEWEIDGNLGVESFPADPKWAIYLPIRCEKNT